MTNTQFTPGGRYAEMLDWQPSEEDGIWWHLGWRRVAIDPGYARMEWEPTSDHSFRAGEGWIVHGGMVTALLDTAMGSATWTLLQEHEVFLTGDLRTEFYRPTVPGLVVAEGRVVHKTRRVTFASAELFDGSGKLLASCRATNLTIDVTSPQDESKTGPASPSRG